MGHRQSKLEDSKDPYKVGILQRLGRKEPSLEGGKHAEKSSTPP